MTDMEHRVEQQILEYQSRLRHLDEVLEKALKENPQRLARVHESMQQADDWRIESIRKAGPMGIWDALAQQIEKVIEHLERH